MPGSCGAPTPTTSRTLVEEPPDAAGRRDRESAGAATGTYPDAESTAAAPAAAPTPGVRGIAAQTAAGTAEAAGTAAAVAATAGFIAEQRAEGDRATRRRESRPNQYGGESAYR